MVKTLSRFIVLAMIGMTGYTQAQTQDSAQSSAIAAKAKPAITATATFAGGCFWCMEGPFDALTGVISTTSGYTGGTKKVAEHGGLAHDDRNVMLLLANPQFAQKMITSPVQTAQVAPTILKSLRLDPRQLKAVNEEHTSILPGIGKL